MKYVVAMIIKIEQVFLEIIRKFDCLFLFLCEFMSTSSLKTCYKSSDGQSRS